MKRRLGIAARIGLAALVGVVALLAAELALRVFRPVTFMRPEPPSDEGREAWHGSIHRPSTTPGLAYELAPLVDQALADMHVVTNSLGMRDCEPLDATTPRLVRVLALGDSVTFAYRVEEPDGFASVLERLLAASPLANGRVFDVLDVGVSGYSTRDELAALEGKWLALEPRVVILGYCMNDPEIVAAQPLQRAFVAPAWWQHSHLLRLAAQKLQSRRVRELGAGNYWRYLHAPGTDSWRSVTEGFARLGELAGTHHFSVVLAIFPMFSPTPWSDYPLRAEHVRVAAEGASRGFVVLDLLPRFEREEPRSLLLDDKDSHPNAHGHRIVAEELLKLFEATPELLQAR